MKTPAPRPFSRATLLAAALAAAFAAMPACDRKKTASEADLPEVDLVAISRGQGKGQTLNAMAKGFEYLHEDKEHGRKTLLSAERAEPGPQGTQILTQPRATLALAANRVLVLSAAKATFTMPKKQPRDGLFAGSAEEPVVFTLYECEAGRTPDLAGTADIRMKVFFEGDARFDLERDAVISDAPVQATGQALEFRGTGVQLTWNRLEQRMEQFDIAKGDVLMARQEGKQADKAPPAAKAPAKSGAGHIAGKDAPASADEARRAARSLFRPGDQDLELHWSGPLILRPVALPEDATDADKAQAKAKPRYDATLTGDVRGHLDAAKGDDEAFFGGAKLDMQFAMAADDGRKDGKKTGKTDAASTQAGALPGPLASGEDTLHLTGDDQTQAFVRTGHGDAIQGDGLSFARGSGRVAAKGSAQRPVVLRTPEGWLTGRSLDLDPGTGKAFVFGPGRLEALAQALPGDAKKNGAKTDAKAEPKPLNLSYADHIEMDFTTEKPKPGDPPRLGAPVETRLFGDIKGEHPDFALACGRLALGFEPAAEGKPDAKKGKVVPARVDLSEGREGQAPVVTLRDPKQGSVTIKAPVMRLALETVGGRTAPSGFTANGPVEAVQGDGSTLACDRLDVDFLPPSQAKNAGKNGAVAALHATGHARYAGKADGKQANLAADHFTMDARKETLELTGSAQSPAKVESQGMGLSGEHVSLQKEGGVARVAGPGRLDLLTKEKQHLVVSWQGKMGWNDAEGLGYFEKQVECAADTPTGTSTLRAEDSLRLAVDPAAKGQEPRKDAKDRAIRLADARGKVIFTGAQTNDGGKLAGRVRVDGPNLVLKNEATEANPGGAQTVTVTGKGLMLVENFDDKRKKSDGAEAFGGQGATFFSWTKTMVMDLAQNDLHLLHDVEIRHLPLKAAGQYAPMAEAVILNCQEVHADLTESGGLGGLHGQGKKDGKPKTEPGAVELRKMTGDYGVLLRRGNVKVDCDHLRYDGDRKQAQLWSDPPRKVELSAQGQNNPAAADRVIWDVGTDTLKAENPSGGAMPQWKK